MIPGGNCTSSSASPRRWLPHSQGATSCSPSGNSKVGGVSTAGKQSPPRRDGTIIISSLGYEGARTREPTTSYCIRTATWWCIMLRILSVSRTRSHECLERLEPDIRERISPVLRGGADGNAAPLPDTMRMTVLGQYLKGLLRLDRE
jgi:hypothetical protein